MHREHIESSMRPRKTTWVLLDVYLYTHVYGTPDRVQNTVIPHGCWGRPRSVVSFFLSFFSIRITYFFLLYFRQALTTAHRRFFSWSGLILILEQPCKNFVATSAECLLVWHTYRIPACPESLSFPGVIDRFIITIWRKNLLLAPLHELLINGGSLECCVC